MSIKDLESESQDGFETLIFGVINAHSRLDLNLGLCLSFQLEPSDPKSSYERIAKLSCAGKIAALREILVGKSSFNEFDTWAQKANRIRAIRNDFAHVSWTFLPHQERAVEAHMAPWHTSESPLELRMTASMFKSIHDEVIEHLKEFMDWRMKFGI